MRHLLLAAAAIAGFAGPATAAVTYSGNLVVAGDATDLAPGNSPNQNRLSFGSDLFYNPRTGNFQGISDRGPGGGLVEWAPRVETFKLDLSSTGAVSNFQLQKTVIFKQANGTPFSGLIPSNPATLGAALDSEGIVQLRNWRFLVSDEYGPSVYETRADGSFLRAFTPPANIVPRANGNPDFANGRPTINSGRQDNRGFEGLTVSGDGSTAFAILQDPLVNEGAGNDGRFSPNLRIVKYDVATGLSTGQYIYQLEGLADINARIPGTATDFAANAQGRNIGVSSITWINDDLFLVIERDNRGLGVTDVTGGTPPIGSKRVYLVDLSGATDVSATSLAGTNTLPVGVTAASKTLFLDIQAQLEAAGVPIAEKIEGLAIGPELSSGGFSLILATDNDFSVTQTGAGVQFDVCSGGSQVAIGAGCPVGQSLLPSRVYAFAVTGADVARFDASLFAVPEPASWAMLIAGFGLTGAALRRRRSAIVA